MNPEISRAIFLDQIPNLPYYPTMISDRVVEMLKQISWIAYAEDHYAVYAHYKYGNPKRTFIIDTHLDHPGFVVKNSGKAIGLGSIHNTETIPLISQDQQYPVSYYSAFGELIAQGYLDNIRQQQKTTVAVPCVTYPAKAQISANTQAVPEINSSVLDNLLALRSADNFATAAIALEILEWLSRSKPEADITVIFNKLEEVAQITATGIAKRGSTPFGQIKRNDFVVNLEVGPVLADNILKATQPINRKTFEGLALVVSDRGLMYQIGNNPNFAEALALFSAQDSGIPVIETSIHSHTDATAYILFGRSTNIITLMIPSLNRHNVDPSGYLAPEVVKVSQVEQLFTLLQRMIINSSPDNYHPGQIVDGENQARANNINIENLRKKRLAALSWAEPRLKQGHLFPDKVNERIVFGIAGLQSRITNF